MSGPRDPGWPGAEAPDVPPPAGARSAMADPRLLVPLLLLVDSLHYVFGRLLVVHLPPVTSAFYVMAVSTAEVALLARGRVRLDVFRRHAGFFLAIGFLVAASTYVGYAAMQFIDPGTAALLSRMSVLFALGLGLVWLRERLVAVEVGGAALAVAGVLAVSFQPGDYLRLGSVLVLAGAFMYALHAALVKRLGGQMAFLDFFLFRLLATTGFLLAMTLGAGALRWPDAPVWGLILLTGTVDIVISRALYYLALRRLEMSLHTVMLTLSPVVTMGWSLLLFGRWPSLQEIGGGAAVLAGVLVVTASRAGLLRGAAPGPARSR
jgi:drug/metabolite transporter (DMT)-like permease